MEFTTEEAHKYYRRFYRYAQQLGLPHQLAMNEFELVLATEYAKHRFQKVLREPRWFLLSSCWFRRDLYMAAVVEVDEVYRRLAAEYRLGRTP